MKIKIAIIVGVVLILLIVGYFILKSFASTTTTKKESDKNIGDKKVRFEKEQKPSDTEEEEISDTEEDEPSTDAGDDEPSTDAGDDEPSTDAGDDEPSDMAVDVDENAEQESNNSTTPPPQLCVYTSDYGQCSSFCGPGKQYKRQVPYTEGMNFRNVGVPQDAIPQPCVSRANRPSRDCTGTLCDDTYDRTKYLSENPGKTYADFCKFIVSENACNNRTVKQKRLCYDQCKPIWG